MALRVNIHHLSGCNASLVGCRVPPDVLCWSEERLRPRTLAEPFQHPRAWPLASPDTLSVHQTALPDDFWDPHVGTWGRLAGLRLPGYVNLLSLLTRYTGLPQSFDDSLHIAVLAAPSVCGVGQCVVDGYPLRFVDQVGSLGSIHLRIRALLR